jgi:hypothetical protein
MATILMQLAVVCCGIALNTQEGSRWWILAVGSVMSSLAMACVLEFVLRMHPGVFKLSGAGPNDRSQLIIATVFGISAFATFVASYGRPMFITLLKGFIGSGKKLKTVETNINLVIKIVGASALLLKALS